MKAIDILKNRLEFLEEEIKIEGQSQLFYIDTISRINEIQFLIEEIEELNG